MDALTLGGFLLMGLTGSLHCAGMCGPLIWLMPFQQQQGARRWTGIALYHAGRIGAYCLLGAAFHSVRGAFDPQWQQGIAFVSGALLILLGILSFTGAVTGRLLKPFSDRITMLLGRVAGRSALGWLSLTGLLNGLLPCGMVYMALGASMRSPQLPQAMFSMAAFGLGTLPMMIAVTLLRRRIRFAGARWTNAFILLFGLLIMLRGANLGVAYLSPERDVRTEKAVPTLKCCHKAK